MSRFSPTNLLGPAGLSAAAAAAAGLSPGSHHHAVAAAAAAAAAAGAPGGETSVPNNSRAQHHHIKQEIDGRTEKGESPSKSCLLSCKVPHLKSTCFNMFKLKMHFAIST